MKPPDVTLYLLEGGKPMWAKNVQKIKSVQTVGGNAN